MQINKVAKLKCGYRTKYRPTNPYRILTKATQRSYEADMEKLKESLNIIEKKYYSSNIKLDRIQNKRTSQIIRAKLPKISKSYKQIFSKT